MFLKDYSAVTALVKCTLKSQLPCGQLKDNPLPQCSALNYARFRDIHNF